MKNSLLKLASLFTIILTATACSNDATIQDEPSSANVLSEESQYNEKSREYYWQGTIGEVIDGNFVITADEALLKADLEEVLANEGRPTTLQELYIEGQVADNDPLDKGYFLLGVDKAGITIGLMLERTGSAFQLMTDNGFTNTVTCEGCVSGCNLRYLNIDGKKVPYCQENGCSEYDCSKSESSF